MLDFSRTTTPSHEDFVSVQFSFLALDIYVENPENIKPGQTTLNISFIDDGHKQLNG
jgi:hypothetical protein